MMMIMMMMMMMMKTIFNELKGYCQGNFAVLWSKLLTYLTKNLFANVKLLLEHREKNIKGFLQGRTTVTIIRF